MIKIENVDISGWSAALRGMRNPKNSWEKSDTIFDDYGNPMIGESDLRLAGLLAKSTPDDGKFLRMIHVQCDVTAPLYWWKEADKYQVGTVTDSCSTMHKIHAKEFTEDDFSHEHLINKAFPVTDEFVSTYMDIFNDTIKALNEARIQFLETKDKTYWWQMIQLLPTSYNQRRTFDLNYAVLRNMYRARKNHKLDEWLEFCTWIKSLPYSELITDE